MTLYPADWYRLSLSGEWLESIKTRTALMRKHFQASASITFATPPLANVNHKEQRNRLCLLIRARKILWPFYFSVYHSPTYNHNDLHFSHLQSNSPFPKTQEKKKSQNILASSPKSRVSWYVRGLRWIWLLKFPSH